MEQKFAGKLKQKPNPRLTWREYNEKKMTQKAMAVIAAAHRKEPWAVERWPDLLCRQRARAPIGSSILALLNMRRMSNKALDDCYAGDLDLRTKHESMSDLQKFTCISPTKKMEESDSMAKRRRQETAVSSVELRSEGIRDVSAPVRRRGGPRTPAGKKRSRLNAVKYGIFSCSVTSRRPVP
jgi:hypothetical protein